MAALIALTDKAEISDGNISAFGTAVLVLCHESDTG